MRFSINKEIKNPLYKNAILLMVNSIVLTGFGFLFWTIIARLYSVRDVGLATTLLSSLELIMALSLIGFNIALIRYLPKAKKKGELISSCFLISGIIALVFSLAFIIGLGIFSPKLLFLKETIIFSLLFALFSVSYVLFTLIDAVFIASREAKFVVLKNVIFGVLKLIIPFSLVFLGAFGIFSSIEISAIAALIICMIIISKRMNMKIAFKIKKGMIKNMFRFSIGNYAGNILFYAPTLILPLIITNLTNPENTAYFYFSIMIAGVIFIIPIAISQSLLTEGSHSRKNITIKVKKAFKLSYMLLIPVVILIFFFGKYLLLLFGETYSENAFRLLQLLAVSSIFSAINIIYISIKNIQKDVKTVIIISFVISASILTLSFFFIKFGLIGVGMAWVLGQIIANCYVLTDFLRNKSKIKKKR